MTPQCLNIIGLLFDMAGVLVLFRWGLSNVVTLDGTGFLVCPPNTPEEGEANKREGRFYLHMSQLGLALILIGFSFQLVSNLVGGGGNNLLQDCKREMPTPPKESTTVTEPVPKQ